MDYKIKNLFPTPVYVGQTEVDIPNLSNIEFVTMDSNNGLISKNRQILDDDLFLNLKEEIHNHIKTFQTDVLNIQDAEFYITTSWINQHNLGHFSHPHFHANSVFSGVVYLQVDNNSGNFIFHRYKNNINENLEFRYSQKNEYNSLTWGFTPCKNDVIIFPSHLVHSVTESFSSNIRYTLAFNVFVRGKLGYEEGYLNL
jgi:uncharacterized protein (TIGR02466 family)